MKTVLTLLILFSAFFVLSCSSVPPEKQCSQDADCVPAACCHASSAVNQANAPACAGMLCTLDCQPGTIDCGQGSIKCLKKQCTVVLN